MAYSEKVMDHFNHPRNVERETGESKWCRHSRKRKVRRHHENVSGYR